MQRKNIAFEQLSDIMAFRVTAATIGDCYQALGIIHAEYPVVPGRFKDYISTPKPNGYRSIHTTVIGPERQRIEIQIRTQEMHQIAELGVAAHWQYKQNAQHTDGRQYRWVRELLDILEHASSPEEFLEHTKLEMFHFPAVLQRLILLTPFILRSVILAWARRLMDAWCSCERSFITATK